MPVHHDYAPRPSNAADIALVAGVVSVLGIVFLVCRAHTGGAFVYAIDDAYIHLAIARTLAEHGVYGPTPYESALASSSIVWPLVLAALPLYDLVPFVLNVVAAGALALVLVRSLRSVVLASAVLFCIPIVPLVFVGMEHTPHALAIVALALAWRNAAHPGILAALAAAAAALRYETGFVVVGLCAVSWHARRRIDAAAIAGGALLPVAAQAVLTGALLPTSVLLKRSPLDASLIPARLLQNPHVFVLLVLLALAWVLRREALIAVAIITMLLHVIFAQFHWFYRYEAYAMALGLTALALVVAEGFRELRRPAFAVPMGLAGAWLFVRGAVASYAVPFACANIHDQQLQTALFLREAYAGRTVVVNDLGLVAWLGQSRIVDLMGLGSPAVAQARLMWPDGHVDADAIRDLTREASVAVIYDGWFVGSVPAEWTPVARMTIAKNTVCAFDTVTFYATAASEVAPLAERVRAFMPRLPTGVTAAVTAP